MDLEATSAKEQITSSELFSQVSRHLHLEWLGGKSGENSILTPPSKSSGGTALLGHLNLIHPNQVQVLGSTECDYVNKLKKNSRNDAFEVIFSPHSRVVLIAENLDVPQGFIDLANERSVPLWRTSANSYESIAVLRYIFTNHLSETTVLHGVFLEVMGIGVLVTGESRVGKSELALELISRGHRLIADDSPLFSRIGPDILNGTSPRVLQDLLEVRGLGILNIRLMYGDNSIKQNKYLKLIIHLTDFNDAYREKEDRLQGTHSEREVLTIKIPEITLPVAPGRNLAVLVEAAVRTHLLRAKGYNAADDLIERQKKLIESQST